MALSSFLVKFSAKSSCNRTISRSSQFLIQTHRMVFSTATSNEEGLSSSRITEIGDGVRMISFTARKGRQHVNPLNQTNQRPADLTGNWIVESFPNPQNKFVVDIGCAKGTWILKSARVNPETNYVGLEIRELMIEYCDDRKLRSGIQNARFVRSNANVDLRRILSDIGESEGRLDMICFHHPDPMYKKRNKKRAVVQPQLVKEIADNVPSGCRIYIQSDLLFVAEEISEHFIHPEFVIEEGYDFNTMDTNKSPHSVKTEREISEEAKGNSIFRMMFLRR